MLHVSRGCNKCADLEVISRLTVGDGGDFITNVALILNVDAQFNLLSYTCTDWLTLSGGAG